MKTGTFITHSEAETRALARDLAADLAAGTTVHLSGDLGAGKTAFVKGLAEGLGIDPDEVTSPTFTLVHEYGGGRLPLVHVDLYRLERTDLEELGLDTDVAQSGVVAIEWSERLIRLMPNRIAILIEGDGTDHRIVKIDASQ